MRREAPRLIWLVSWESLAPNLMFADVLLLRAAQVGNFRGVFADVSLLHTLARYILMAQALVERGAVGFFANAVRTTKPKKPGFPKPYTPIRNPNVDMNVEEIGTDGGV